MAVKAKSRYDLQEVHETLMDWASYQNLGGDLDNVEVCPIAGTYDWRVYIQEEARIAQKRDEARASKREKKRDGPAPTTAPSVFYA